jgi:hypothetical protein
MGLQETFATSRPPPAARFHGVGTDKDAPVYNDNPNADDAVIRVAARADAEDPVFM